MGVGLENNALIAIITEDLSSAKTILRALHPLSYLILTAVLEVNGRT